MSYRDLITNARAAVTQLLFEPAVYSIDGVDTPCMAKIEKGVQVIGDDGYFVTYDYVASVRPSENSVVKINVDLLIDAGALLRFGDEVYQFRREIDCNGYKSRWNVCVHPS